MLNACIRNQFNCRLFKKSKIFLFVSSKMLGSCISLLRLEINCYTCQSVFEHSVTHSIETSISYILFCLSSRMLFTEKTPLRKVQRENDFLNSKSTIFIRSILHVQKDHLINKNRTL